MNGSPIAFRSFPPLQIAYMRHVGPYGSPAIAALWERFERWCAGAGLASPRRRMYGIAQDNPNITPPDRVRYDLGVEVDAGFQPAGEIGVQTLPGGRFACVPFVGTAAEIKAAWVRLLGHTLPGHGYEPDLCPAIEIYEPDYVVDPRAGRFSCLLCMPVRAGLMPAPAAITFRPAAPGELDRLSEIDDDASRLYAEAGLSLSLPHDSPFVLAERARWLASAEKGRTFLAVDASGDALGFAAFDELDGLPYLDQLSVRVRAMRRGIGRRLLALSVDWARGHGGGALWLTTWSHLPFNRPFYEREGFVVVPESRCSPGVRHHLAEQRRWLPAPELRVAMRRPL